jgi:hypothetical protein
MQKSKRRSKSGRANNPVTGNERKLSAAADNEGNLAPSDVGLFDAGKVIPSGGEQLDTGTRAAMESRFGHDFGSVRVHAGPEDAKAASALSAEAYTLGTDIVFGAGRYAPQSREGRSLLAHELTHVVQQAGGSSDRGLPGSGTSDRGLSGGGSPDRGALSAGPAGGAMVQRKIELKDVPKGGQSGFARLPELVTRLNNISKALIFSIKGNQLTYKKVDGGTESDFDIKMKSFIDQGDVIPLIVANHNQDHGIIIDQFPTGTVDIDDILASDDLNLQLELVHFLTERTATTDYAKKIKEGTHIPIDDFKAAHAKGLAAETQVLQDFFGDYSIAFDHTGPAPVSRSFKNDRGDQIQVIRDSTDGLDAYSTRAITHEGQTLTAVEYKELLAKERTARQIDAQKVRAGTTEYREGGKAVPSP